MSDERDDDITLPLRRQIQAEDVDLIEELDDLAELQIDTGYDEADDDSVDADELVGY